MRFEEVHAVRCDRCLHAVSHCHGAPRAEPGDDGCLVCYVDCDITCVTRELGEVLVRGGLWDVERQVPHQVPPEWLPPVSPPPPSPPTHPPTPTPPPPPPP